eukprot:5194384-Pyramimonas_sp.AAC.1
MGARGEPLRDAEEGFCFSCFTELFHDFTIAAVSVSATDGSKSLQYRSRTGHKSPKRAPGRWSP